MALTDPHHHDETSDDVLVRLVCQGDEDALSALYRRYVEAIYRFVLAQVRDVQDAEDLTSETFARTLRALSGFRGEASFKNWLYQIARNSVRNHRRAAGYRRTVPLSRRMITEPPRVRSVDSGDRDQVIGLLQPLPPRYRQVLELRFLEGRSIEETAARMSVSVGNAKVLQHRALRKAASIAKESGVEARSAR